LKINANADGQNAPTMEMEEEKLWDAEGRVVGVSLFMWVPIELCGLESNHQKDDTVVEAVHQVDRGGVISELRTAQEQATGYEAEAGQVPSDLLSSQNAVGSGRRPRAEGGRLSEPKAMFTASGWSITHWQRLSLRIVRNPCGPTTACITQRRKHLPPRPPLMPAGGRET
jgi:hypothetical protein